MRASSEFARKELGAFLRSRRERRTPAEVGLGGSGRRRTPGLRRAEVARLAGVSVTWYTWLEQGRDIRVSHQVVASIARTLGLSDAEREHLLLLADDKAPTPWPPRAPAHADTSDLLAALDPFPSWSFNEYFDIVALNRSAAGLLEGIDELPATQRNAVRLMFCDPRSRLLLPEWETEAVRLVTLLRGAAAAAGGDRRHVDLVNELRDRSASFRRIWDSRDVGSFTPSTRLFRHPAVGLLRLRYHRLDVAGCGLSVIIHFLPPDDVDYPLLGELARLGSATAAAPASA